MSIKVTCVVKDYDNPAKTDVRVDSDWAFRHMVVITVGEEKRTIDGYDLIEAIKNCLNARH